MVDPSAALAGPRRGGELPTNARNLESLWAAAVALAVAVPLALLHPEVSGGAVRPERLAWPPSLGVDIIDDPAARFLLAAARCRALGAAE